MLGHKLVQRWENKFEVWTTVRKGFDEYQRYGIFNAERTIDRIDAEDFERLQKVIDELQPAVIVNAVGIIKQLPTSKNVIKTLTVNAILPHRLAEAAGRIDARFITLGTDCVFDGKQGNYKEEDVSNATDVYGKSKSLGEVEGAHCLTLRTSIIGRELQTSHSLVEWFLSNRGKKVKGYVKAIYTGFPTIVLADIIADLIERHQQLNGLYQVSSDPINKFELLKLINEAYDANIEIEPFADVAIDRSLDSTKFRRATGFEPPSWREMIKMMADDRTPYDEWRK